MKIKIWFIWDNEFLDYKNLRLKALKDNPDEFWTTYKEALNISDDEWKSKLAKANKYDWIFLIFAKYDDKLVWMIWCLLEKWEKVKHIANIIWFYIDKDLRWKWVWKKLFQEMLNEIKSNNIFKKIVLHVITTNINAIWLYKSFWFEIVWTLKNELKSWDKYFDEYIMEKYL